MIRYWLILVLQWITLMKVTQSKKCEGELGPHIHDNNCVVVISHNGSEVAEITTILSDVNACVMSEQHAISNPRDLTKMVERICKEKWGYTCTIISLLHGKHHHLIGQLIRRTHVSSCEYCDVITEVSSMLNNSSEKNACAHGDNIYIRTFVMLVSQLLLDQVTVIAERNECNLQATNVLRKRIEDMQANSTSQYMTFESFIIPSTDNDELIKRLHEYDNRGNRQAFILLASIHVTNYIFFLRNKLRIHDDYIWITKHRKYNISLIPPNTITYSERPQRIFLPKQYGSRRIEMNETCCVDDFHKGRIEAIAQMKKIIYELKEPIISRFRWRKRWISVFQTDMMEGVFHASMFFNDSEILSNYGANFKSILSVVSIIDPPFLYIKDQLTDKYLRTCGQGLKKCRVPLKHENSSSWKETCCYGYIVDLLFHLERELRVKGDLYIVEDGNYGGYDRALRTYNGMVGDVIRKKADLALAGLTITAGRSRFVDFSAPFMVAEIATIKLKESDQINLNSLAPFSLESAFGLLGLMVGAYTLIYIVDNCVTYKMRQIKNIRNDKEGTGIYPFQECFSYVSGLIFQRDIGGKTPKSLGGRTIAIHFAFGMLTITTLYTAALTANQVVKNTDDFLGLKDPKMMFPTDDFKFGTAASTSIEDFFRFSNDETMKRMARFMAEYNTKNLDEGVGKVKRGELQAYIHESPFLKYTIAQDPQCELEMYENQIGQSSYGFAVSKNSALKNTISRVIRDLQKDKELVILTKKWLSSKCVEHWKSHQSVSVRFVAASASVVAGSIIFVFFILLLECAIGNYRGKRRKYCVNTRSEHVPQNVLEIANYT